MSYCVECGVKLADSEKICPLCSTVVINPNNTEESSAERPYPSSVERQIRGLNRRELAWIVFMFILLPVGASVIIDLLTGAEAFHLTWSVFVLGSGCLLGVWALVPIVFPSLNLYLHVIIDFAAIAGLLAVIAFELGSWDWCLRLGIPITAATCLLACAFVAIVRSRKLMPLTKAALLCVCLGLYILGLEIIIDMSQGFLSPIRWSIYAIVPLLFLALLLFYISRKPRLMDELKRRLFV